MSPCTGVCKLNCLQSCIAASSGYAGLYCLSFKTLAPCPVLSLAIRWLDTLLQLTLCISVITRQYRRNGNVRMRPSGYAWNRSMVLDFASSWLTPLHETALSSTRRSCVDFEIPIRYCYILLEYIHDSRSYATHCREPWKPFCRLALVSRHGLFWRSAPKSKSVQLLGVLAETMREAFIGIAIINVIKHFALAIKP
jgi:hypothetical protein